MGGKVSMSMRNVFRMYSTAIKQSSVPASYYRGGTSRAIIFRESDLPKSTTSRRALFLQSIGAPDPHGRQLNGMGAGVSSLSKICIVGLPPQGSSQEADYDVTYTFVGIGIERDEVDYAGNCGNMSSAIGPYAYNARILPVAKDNPDFYSSSGSHTVRILNTNTNKIIQNTFKVSNGQAQVDDETHIDGVSGLGTGVTLDFLHPSGSKTSGLLPTRTKKQVLEGYEVSCVDAANPCVFVRAKDLGVDPTILPAQLSEKTDIRETLERIRAAGAIAMGITKPGEQPPRVIPKIALVSPKTLQVTLSGSVNLASELDLVARFISDAQPHRAIPLTGALCTAAAAMVDGTIVNEALDEKKRKEIANGSSGMVRIGHPSGRVEVGATMDGNGGIEHVSVIRTTRRLFEGHVFFNDIDH